MKPGTGKAQIWMDQHLSHITSKLQQSQEERACILWPFALKGNGYGQLQVAGKNCYPHRYIWEYFKGTIPDNLEICHKCNNKQCVNPFHLALGTHWDNMQDAVGTGRFGARNRYCLDKVLSFACSNYLRAEGKTLEFIGKVVGLSISGVSRRLSMQLGKEFIESLSKTSRQDMGMRFPVKWKKEFYENS